MRGEQHIVEIDRPATMIGLFQCNLLFEQAIADEYLLTLKPKTAHSADVVVPPALRNWLPSAPVRIMYADPACIES
jgi:hypothetical protein